MPHIESPHVGKDVHPQPRFESKCLFIRDKEDVPHEAALPDLYNLGSTEQIAAPVSKIDLPDRTTLVGDPTDWDCALIVQPGTTAADMRKALAVVRLLGLEPLGDDEDEDEPELLDDGSVRLWLVPVDPEDPFETAEEMESIA